MVMRPERTRIPDLTPPHKNKTTWIHGIGSQSVSDYKEEHEENHLLIERVLKALLRVFAEDVNWDKVNLEDIDWENWEW